jgi:MSHA biogenesis protein MshQ
VSYDIDEWLKYDWNNNGSYVDKPRAIATFGVFRGNDRIISWREVF